MAGSDDEWVFLDGDSKAASVPAAVSNGQAEIDKEAEVTEEETGVTDDGGVAVPAPADCASGGATESAADDDYVSEDDCDCGSHCYTDASEEDGTSDGEAYSDDGTTNVDDYLEYIIDQDHDKDTRKKVYGATASANAAVVDAHPVSAAAAHATNEHPDGAADNDVSGNHNSSYGYGYGDGDGDGDRAYLDGCYIGQAVQAYYGGYQYLARHQPRVYQPYYVPVAGMYPPVPYVYPYLYAQPANPYGYAYILVGYAPCAPMREPSPYGAEPSAPPHPQP